MRFIRKFAALITAAVSIISCTGVQTAAYKADYMNSSILSEETTSFYEYWKEKYLAQDPYVTDETQYYVFYGEQSYAEAGYEVAVTVSEAHGYGMLIVASMADYDSEAKEIFDGMYRYYRSHLSSIGPNLMAWQQTDNGSAIVNSSGADSATDGDMDIAYALLMADSVWGSDGEINYKQAAVDVINDIMTYEVNKTDWVLQLGDWAYWSDEGDAYYAATRSSDFIVQYMPVFAEATGDERWLTLYENTYSIINKIVDDYDTGILPDFIIKDRETGEFIPAPANFLESENDGNYYYNACRTPWRISMDYLINGNENALRFANTLNDFIIEETGGDPWNIMAGYTPEGTAVSDWNDLCFNAPFMVAAACDENTEWHDDIRSMVLNYGEDVYFGDTIAMLCLIVDDGCWIVPEEAEVIRGDVNADGKFNVADVVMLQNWLVRSGDITDWQAGDLCEDNQLDVFDLVAMRKELINAATTPEEREFSFSVAEGLFNQADTDTLSLSYPDGLETVTVWKAEEEGDHYCNGVCLAAYQGKLYCQWQSSAMDEDSADTHVMYSVSSDNGKTWSTPQVLAENIGDGYCTSGGWLATDDQLVAYINFWPTDLSPRGGYTYYMTTQDGNNWSEVQPVMMADGTPMNAIFEQDPHVLESGRIVNSAHFQEGLVVCPIYTDDPSGVSGWKKGEFTPTISGSTSVEMEPSLFVQSDGTIVMIFRDQNSSYTKFVSYSLDDGVTWSEVLSTDMPDARTKQSAGNLSDGTAFMAGCPVNDKLRSPLAVTLSADGKTFDHAYLIRSTSSDPELVYEGTAKRKGFHYTKSLVYNGYLYVGYATNKEAVEISIIPESSLMLN